MISLILGYLGSAAGGAILKGIFGLWSEAQRNKHERKLLRANLLEQSIKHFHSADNFTKFTRRLLALSICWTYCAILLLWSLYPDVVLLTFIEPNTDAQGYGVKVFGLQILGATIPPNLADRVLAVTTGHLVVANSYFLTFILSAYFMPIGRK